MRIVISLPKNNPPTISFASAKKLKTFDQNIRAKLANNEIQLNTLINGNLTVQQFIAALLKSNYPNVLGYFKYRPHKLWMRSINPEQISFRRNTSGSGCWCINREDISVRKLIEKSNQERDQHKYLKEACRFAIRAQIKDHLFFNEKVCVKCESKQDLEVDHCGLLEFADIVECFKDFALKHSPNWLEIVEIPKKFVSDPGHRIEGASQFRRFHLDVAQLQTLCKTCHLKKSKEIKNKPKLIKPFVKIINEKFEIFWKANSV